ncbi:uncharacterized protein LOC133296093 [Gastrolobium bilobum]|uniref:uncharacterized protein LOC133296093 n=1 Tax=Gastrolobium bilobum TaxID=150636 RepID=UPI002AB29DC1|nr:uncharacterized protein LOC133296093 [Gastrolobium bilobum]XP_061351036.1 uncharacterized protein LOC133296093 [Gastrolobium bilobum]
MAELKNQQEPAFPSKRKLDSNTDDLPNKVPNLATLDNNEAQEPNPISDNNNSELPSTTNCSSEKEGGNDDDDNELENDDEFDDDEEEDEDEEDEEDEVDRKGKGVLRDDKGKGKLIEEEEEDDDDDDDDDSGDDGNVSGGDSDFSDDPLAEVDLNNILPSRTRRRTAHPGVHIASDMGNVGGDDDDDSDDSDA